MAYSYNLVNPFEPQETEEERRQRLAREAAMRGEVMAPVAPVVPDDTYQQMLQVESGNRDYTAQGQPVVSPAGAKYAAQVMPATAQQPGFGIRPAAADTAEEYNRVGREYFAAMQNRYGDDTLAAAAYNAGPGRVDAALKQAQQTGRPVQEFLPQETQQYIQKVSTQNVGPVAPTAQTQEPRPALGTGITVPGMTAVPMGQDSTQAINRYQEFQNDPANLLKLKNDDTMPEFIRTRSGERAFDIMNQERQVKEAERKLAELSSGVAQGDRKATNALSRELASQEGNWLKYLLLRKIDPDMAREEAAKLGYGNRWQTTSATVDGQTQRGMVEFNAKGLPVKGIKQDGTAMTENELLQFGTQGTAGKVTTSGTFFQTPQGQILRAQSDERGNSRLVDAATGQIYGGTTRGLTKLEEAGQMRRIDYQLTADLKRKHGENVLAAEKEYVELNGPFATPDERQTFRQQYGFGMAQPGVQAQPTAQPAVAATQPGVRAQPTAPTAPIAPQAMAQPQRSTAVPIAQQRQQQAVGLEEQKQFVEYYNKEFLPKASAAGEIKNIRKSQLTGPDGILNNPEIAGILSGQGGASTEAGNIIRDLVSGNYRDPDELSRRINSLGLTQRQKDVLNYQVGLQRDLNPQTIRETAPVGAITDFEQKANAERNVDILRTPIYSGLTLLTRDQFNKDLTQAQRSFREQNPGINTRRAFDTAWSSEKRRLQEEYNRIYSARAGYIAKYGSTPGTVVDAFKYYPVPEFDSSTGQWNYGTDFSRKAARPPLTSFVR